MWLAGDLEERCGPVERDVGQVRRGRANEGRQQRVGCGVFLEGHLDGEDGPGGGRLEDRRDTRRRAGHQQQSQIVAGQVAPEAPLEKGPDPGTHIYGGPFEAHGASEAERGDRGQHPSRKGTGIEGMLGIVIGVQVLLGGRRARVLAQPAQRGPGQHQTDAWGEGLGESGQLEDPFEDRAGGQPVKAGDRQTRDDPGQRREQQHPVPASCAQSVRQAAEELPAPSPPRTAHSHVRAA